MKVFLIKIFSIYLLFFQVFSLAIAEEATEKEIIKTNATSSSVQNASFYSGLNQYIAGDKQKSAKEFIEFKKETEKKGYKNISGLSISLLEKARSEKLKGDLEGARFLEGWSKKLSPSDSKISLLNMSSFSSAVSNLKYSPSLFSVIFVNSLQLAAISLTVSLFIVLVIQLGKNSEILIDYSFSLLPLNYRGFLGPLVTAFLLVVPLYFGLAISLACWSVLLGYCFKNCKFLPLFTALVFFFWVFPLQYAKKYVILNNEPVLISVESINSGNFNYRDKEILEKELDKDRSSELFSYFYGQSLAREGEFQKASVYFKSVLNSANKKSALYKNALVNSGALSLVQKNFKDSQSKLEESIALGEDSFEVYYNLSQAKMSLLDTIAHGKFYKLAKESNSSLLEWSEANKLAEDVPLFKPMNLLELNKTIFKSERFKKLQENQNLTSKLESNLYSALFPIKEPKQAILILASLLFLIGLFIIKRKVKDTGSAYKAFFSNRISFVWHGFPAGGLIAGSRPVLGALFLATILACVMAVCEKPVSLLSMSSLPLNYQNIFLSLAAVSFMSAILFSLFLNNKGSKPLKAKNAGR